MPVPLTSRGDDGVTSSNLVYGATPLLHPPNAFGHMEDLTIGMPVPGRTGGRCEVHTVGAKP